MSLLSRDEQRQKEQLKLQVGVGLECHLRNLVREILAGDSSQLQEFQQYIQYATPEMRERIQVLLDERQQ